MDVIRPLLDNNSLLFVPMQILVEIVKGVFQLPNAQRVAGPTGKVGRVHLNRFGVGLDMYADEIGLPHYWPNALVVAVSCAF